MRKRIGLLLMVLLIGSVLAAGCIGSSESGKSATPSSSSSPSSKTTSSSTTTTTTTTSSPATTTTTTATKSYYPITVVDFANRTVKIEKSPERVVTLAPSLTEDLYYLGLIDRVVGVTKYDDFPPEVENITRVGGYGKKANLELIASLNPDLIIADNYAISILDKLEEIAPVLIVSPKGIDDVPKALELLGEVFNVQGKAQEEIADFTGKIEYFKSITANVTRPKVFYIVWGDPLMTMGGDTFISDIIWLAGGVNVFNDTKGWPQVDMEQVIERDPDVIILTPHCGMTLDDAYSKFADTTAAKEKRIYMIENENDLIHPSPRLINGINEVLQILHPELVNGTATSTFGVPAGVLG